MAASNIKIPLKVVIHKQEERVLFAEANADFVDILFSFLTLPMGTIVRLLSNHSNTSKPQTIGSFNNLYRSISNLEAKYFATGACKDMLLNTRNSAEAQCEKLKINVDDIKPVEYFTCEDMRCTENYHTAYLSTNSSVKCKNCSGFLTRKAYFSATTVGGQQGVFVQPTSTFVITDDLHVISDVPASTLAILKKSGLTDFGVLEEKVFNIGHTEILKLLKYSFLSKTPLTSMFLGKNYIIIDKSVQTISSQMSTEGNISFKKMTLKVWFQKSSHKILLAEAGEDFAEFLFSFFSVPLGSVISLLSSGHASTLVAENLYKSVSNLSVGRYFISQEMKDLLLDPRLAEHYLSSNLIFPLREAKTPQFNCKRNYFSYSLIRTSNLHRPKSGLIKNPVKMNLVNPRGSEKFMNAPTMFMVTDDLVVTPLSSTACFTYLNSLKVPPCDVNVQVVNIGMKEALNLLRATLKTTSVLTNGLKNCMLKTQKQMK